MSPSEKICRGTRDFRAIAVCMVLAGLSTFALMNCVQPLMPLFSEHFAISPAQASLSLSVNIAVLAALMPFASLVSERFGRKPVLVASLLASGGICLLSASASSWPLFLLYRGLQGAAFSGVPAIAMAYIAEEIDSRDSGYAAGIYVSGAAIGGMSGRVIAGFIADAWGWQASLLAIGALGVSSALLFSYLLPHSRHFNRHGASAREQLANYRRHATDHALQRAYLTAFMMMGVLVMVYNYLGFRLTAAPFNLSPSLAGSLFMTYLAGIYASTLAGRLSDRLGARRVSQYALALCLAGVLLMVLPSVWLVVVGLVLFTVGYFAAHAAANGSVSRRASVGKSQASTLYFIAFYTGGALLGWLGGVAWGHLGWPGVTALLLAALALTWGFGLSTLKPVTSQDANA